MRRRVEASLGIATAVIALVSLGYALLAPTYAGQVSTTTAGGAVITTGRQASLLEMQGVPLFLVIMLGCAVVVAVGALLHARSGRRAALILVWTMALALVAGMILSLFSIGILLVPVVVSALLTAGLASWPTRPSAPLTA